MKIDLHVHSDHSDGQQSIDELFQLAAEGGIDVIAVTDHDTTKGWSLARVASDKYGVGFVPGIEVTTRTHTLDADGKAISFGMHLLAYLPNPEDQALIEVFNEIIPNRAKRLEALTEKVATVYPVSWDEVMSFAAPGATLGRPMLAKALVARGYFKAVSEVFEEVWTKRHDLYEPNKAIDTLEAIRIVRSAGGVPVLAHPFRKGRFVEDSNGRRHADFVKMVEAGLGGLEIYHHEIPKEARPWLIDFANDFDLIQTGSSDFHGSAKANQLGDFYTTEEMFSKLVSQASGSKPHNVPGY